MDHTAELVARIDAWLPQTQCTRCGYPRCRAYAEAIARGAADINQCPPGGDATIRALAQLLGVAPRALNPAYGAQQGRQIALIDEARCIGCRKCLEVCPVDAIIGARKLMHTVIAAECSGCELCLPPCPVDCILMIAAPNAADPASPWPQYARAETERWRSRTEARLARLERRRQERRAARGSVPPAAAPATERERIRAEIRAAVERVRARKRDA